MSCFSIFPGMAYKTITISFFVHQHLTKRLQTRLVYLVWNFIQYSGAQILIWSLRLLMPVIQELFL